MARAIELRKGNVFEFRGALWRVLDTTHTRTGKGGGYVQIRMQNVMDRHVETERFSSSQTVEKAFVESRRMQYLYRDGQDYVFMNPKDGDQMNISPAMLDDAVSYLAYNLEVDVTFHEGSPVEVKLPPSVALEVVKTDPAVRGDTATDVTKPAKVETGLVVKVPGHVKVGDRISVDTRTGDFLGRA